MNQISITLHTFNPVQWGINKRIWWKIHFILYHWWQAKRLYGYPVKNIFNIIVRQTNRSIPNHRACRSENQNTSVVLPRRWSSYVTWFVLHIRVEAWVAQVISCGGIDEGNSNTSCSVWIVERNGRMRIVSLTNNFKFCRLNWKKSSFELLSYVFLTVLD